MSKNLEVKDIPQKIMPLIEKARKYTKISFFVFMILACCFLVLRINSFASTEPTESQVDDKLETVKRPHIDQASIEKIQQLQDQNVQVQSLFKDARDNPFSE